MAWKKLKKFEDWNVALIGLIAILIFFFGIVLGAKYGFKERKLSFEFPDGMTEEEMKNALGVLYSEKVDITIRLDTLNMFIKMYEWDLEAIQNNMTIKYIDVPNSTLISRVEYNGSSISEIEFDNIIDSLEVKRD